MLNVQYRSDHTQVRCVMDERESLPTWDEKPAAMLKQWRRADAVGSASEFCNGRLWPLCLDLVCRYGFVHGMGSAGPVATTGGGARRTACCVCWEARMKPRHKRFAFIGLGLVVKFYGCGPLAGDECIEE